jgi:hypothetical protein
MSNSRSSRRPGTGVHFGSLNPAIHVGDTSPKNPRDKDLWFDTTASPGTWKYYDLDTDTWTT